MDNETKMISLSNEKCQLWFEKEFTPNVLHQQLKKDVKSGAILHWSLHGSRFLNIAYPESDIDIAIIVNDQIDVKEQCQILGKLGYEVKLTPRTKLPITSFNIKDLPKVEICVYTHTGYLQWYLHNTRSIAKWSQEERTTYISKMRECFINKDSAGKQKLKRWAYFELDDIRDLSRDNPKNCDLKYLFTKTL